MVNAPYRPNVAVVVFNAQGEVLQGERIDIPNAWQFPQGGIDENESPLTAAKREIYEEVGIQDAILVYEYPDWLTYDYPPEIQAKFQQAGKQYNQGQTQKWFLFYWDGDIQTCNLERDREFRAVRFVPIRDSLQGVAEFKRQVYETVLPVLEAKIKEYLRAGNPAL